MTIIENSGGAGINDSENKDHLSKSVNESPDISDEDLILELDNMIEEEKTSETKTGLEEIDEAALDIGMDASQDVLDIDEDILDLGDSIEPEVLGIDQSGLSGNDDDIIELSDDEHIEELFDELDDAGISELTEYPEGDEGASEDDLLEIEDLVSDETLQYDPLLSKSKTDEVYLNDESPRSSRPSEDYEDIDLLADYGAGYEEDMGLEISSDIDISDDGFNYGESSLVSGLSIEQIEAAVERVVTKLFIDRMETMLAEVMERVVREELSNLKKSLMDDQPD